MAHLTSFPLLDTIEVVVHYSGSCDLRLTEHAASSVKEASRILKENKSQAEKTVLVTKWNNIWDYGSSHPDADKAYVTKEVVKL